MTKFKSIIKENINMKINKIIKENDINILDDAKREFLEAVESNPLSLNVGRGEIEIPSSNFTFYIDYVLNSDAYYDSNDGSYEEEPWSERYNEDKYEVTHFNVTAYDEESDMEVNFVPDEDMFQIIKPLISVDYSNYNDIPSKEEYFN